MLAMLLTTGVLIAACSMLGQAAAALCGWERWQWWSPALGYALLMIVFGQAVRMRGLQPLLFAVVVIALVAAVAWRPVRQAARTVALDWLLLGAGITLLAAVPFFAAGHAGILGASVSNDMSQHLTGAWWLNHDSAPLPVAAIGGNLVDTGYPLGPHALAAALSRYLGLGEVRGFSALTLAVPALTAFCAFGLASDARRAPRLALAAVAGLGYLPAAYLGQGSFKETILAMLILATATVMTDLAARPDPLRWTTAVPVGLLTGGAVYAYSYGGLLWIGAVAIVFLLAEAFRRRPLRAMWRHWRAPLIGAVAGGVLVILPELGRMIDFRNSIFGQEPKANKGNLVHALNPLETFGVWFSGDFRFNPDPYWLSLAMSILALGALLASVVWWWRRRAVALPAAVLAALLVWIQLTRTVNIYNAAKGLVVLAPLVVACLGVPLAVAWSGRATRPLAWVARLTGVVLFAGMLVATAGVLRWAPVGLGSHDEEFAQIRALVRSQPVVFIDNDHFAQWELRGADPLYTTNALYAPKHLGQHPEKTGGLPVDVDNYGSPDLDKAKWLVISGGRYTSEIPPNFKLALQTPSYKLYRRAGPTPLREPIEPPGKPGVVFDCRSARGREYLARYKWAGVLPKPIVRAGWQGSIARPGESARMQLTLPRGRWDLSLEYASRTGVDVRAPGVRARLAPNFGLITSFWPAGTITSDGRPLTITLTNRQRSWFGQLLGGQRPMRSALSPGKRPLFRAAFTRHGATPQRTPSRQACGRYVDWFAPASSSMRGRSDEAR